MDRRNFIRSLTAGTTGLLLHSSDTAREGLLAQHRAQSINTVRGPLPSEKLGITLMHEHVLVDFVGADKVSRDRYDPEEVFSVALPFMKELYALGCRTMVECTPAYLGRDPALLRRLSKATGLNIVTNTGYYGAANDKFIPQHAFHETPEQLAGRWYREFEGSIGATNIKAGIIKIGVDKGALSEIDTKLVRAAAMTHLRTGLTIASHTEDGVAALEELDLLKKEGVAASAFIWVHAQSEPQTEKHFKAVGQGAWVEYDGISESSLDKHINLVKSMIDRGFIHRTLLSQDAGWYSVGEPGGGNYRNYGTLFTRFIPELKKSGVSEEQVRKLLVDNPKQALLPRVRSLFPGHEGS
jgi:predicted metal-dependent phosphotriesterase family hydrolase